jgi:hypothetical protein
VTSQRITVTPACCSSHTARGSGKSIFAEALAPKRGNEDVLFVATAEARDEEMRARIQAHRLARHSQWQTLEAPREVLSKERVHAVFGANVLVQTHPIREDIPQIVLLPTNGNDNTSLN